MNFVLFKLKYIVLYKNIEFCFKILIFLDNCLMKFNFDAFYICIKNEFVEKDRNDIYGILCLIITYTKRYIYILRSINVITMYTL